VFLKKWKRALEIAAIGIGDFVVNYEIIFTYRSNRYSLKAGINNLTDKAYFTRRTDEYPILV